MVVVIEKDPEDKQTYLNISNRWLRMPDNTDYETFRKTDPDWKKLATWFNRRRLEAPHGVIKEGPEHWKERFVFAAWPRNPDGDILKASPPGKATPNGCELWGATLFDFYRVQRIPKNIHLSTLSTGSKLSAWMKEHGELDWAKDQLRRAEAEEEPHQIHVFDIGQYIEVLEDQVWKRRVGKSMEIDRSNSKVGTQFLYAPSKYPAPWPLRPFSAPLARLQKKVPYSALPRKLLVHDPWNALLTTDSESKHINPKKCKWGKKRDIVRTYHLKLNGGASKKEDSKNTGAEAETGPKHDDSEATCPVAHLYICPKRRIGKGHHSFVYQVELELPREMLVKPKACWECSMENYRKEIVSKGKGKPPLEGLKKKLTDAENYFAGVCKRGQQSLDEKQPSELSKYVSWQSRAPFCEHLSRDVPVPPSQRVSVTAKLCLPNDYHDEHAEHLRREAVNYQSFPSHMFEHWNGYNIIQPMHNPTPVGAVAPQFYGFYVPDEENEPIKKQEYMSPILLLEHCGMQVDLEQLTMDQREECFSMLRRLHHAGFAHQSVYSRNMLMQYGPLQDSPFKRSKLHPRFRLIDFGRTYKCENDRQAWITMSSEADNANRNLGLALMS